MLKWGWRITSSTQNVLIEREHKTVINRALYMLRLIGSPLGCKILSYYSHSYWHYSDHFVVGISEDRTCHRSSDTR